MRSAWLVWLAVAGCAEPAGDDGPRGDVGKADLYGSCSSATRCGHKSDSGNCWCDDACLGNGDCCSDKPTVCPGGLSLATYNAGLAHGAVPFAVERVQPLVDEIRSSPADVMCLQEVWSDADAEAIIAGVAETFPHAFREQTENDESSWFACGAPQWPALYTMNSCVSEQCTPSGISAFECAADQCKAEWAALDDHCKLCLSANTQSPLKCAAWRAPMYAHEGRNGLVVLSRTPLEHASYTPFETFVVKRGVIRADVGGLQIQCTHMTASLDVVPYPAEGRFGSWQGEHAAQLEIMKRQAGERRRTIMLGDLNAGPASAGVDAELPDNYSAVAAAGYRDTWTSGQVCTYCQDNPLVCSKPEGCGPSSRIDHILLKSFERNVELGFARFGDQAIPTVGRLSDHYGLRATLPY